MGSCASIWGAIRQETSRDGRGGRFITGGDEYDGGSRDLKGDRQHMGNGTEYALTIFEN